MSWDKNTVNLSKINAALEVLNNLAVPYQLTTLDSFIGRGLNDGFFEDKGNMYDLRRLQYKDKVLLEYVELDRDCDVNDLILSEEFNVGEEPKDWVAVRKTDKLANCGDE